MTPLTDLPLRRIPAFVDLRVEGDIRPHRRESHCRSRGDELVPLVDGRERDIEGCGDSFLVATECPKNV
jgi:hypothetical protein